MFSLNPVSKLTLSAVVSQSSLSLCMPVQTGTAEQLCRAVLTRLSLTLNKPSDWIHDIYYVSRYNMCDLTMGRLSLQQEASNVYMKHPKCRIIRKITGQQIKHSSIASQSLVMISHIQGCATTVCCHILHDEQMNRINDPKSQAHHPASEAFRRFIDFDTNNMANELVNASGQFVRNCKDTAADEKSSWIAHYRKFVPANAYTHPTSTRNEGKFVCAVAGCPSIGCQGGHVMFQDMSQLFIVPLCAKHNNPNRDDYYPCSCPYALKLYEAKRRWTSVGDRQHRLLLDIMAARTGGCGRPVYWNLVVSRQIRKITCELKLLKCLWLWSTS